MHPLLAFAGASGPNLASWLLAHSGALGDAAARVVRPVMAALADPTGSVERIGPALVAVRNGQTEVLGVLHRHTAELDGIAAAVDGVGRAVDTVARTTDLLAALSMVGLGLTVLSQVHIAAQFAALTRRIERIDRDVREIRELLHQQHRAQLEQGLDDLSRAGQVEGSDPIAGRTLRLDARRALAGSRAVYTQQLAGHLAPPPRPAPAHLWMLARHLTTAALGEATCYLHLDQPHQAADVLRAALQPLRAHAAVVFGRTVADPTRFLIPAAAEHVTLDALADLYRHARHAGVLTADRAVTAAGVFEELRAHLGRARNPWFRRGRTVERLRVEFAEAVAAVEEVNRVSGLALLVERCTSGGRDYLELTAQIAAAIAERGPTAGACFAAFPAL